MVPRKATFTLKFVSIFFVSLASFLISLMSARSNSHVLSSMIRSFECYSLSKNKKSFLEKIVNYKDLSPGQMVPTRKAFGYGLQELASVDNSIFVLDADVSNSTYTSYFAEKYPDRFIQCFIAEQNMIGVAIGLSLRGKAVFLATFAAFLTRAFDQFRMAGVGRNVLRVIGSHCGVSIGADGPSQMGLEDIAMFRVIPNSVVLYPSDGVSAFKMVELLREYDQGISYLRTTRASTKILYDSNSDFKIGGCKVLRESEKDVICIVAAGITLHEALMAYEKLKQVGVFISVIDLYSIKPFDFKTVSYVAIKSGSKILTVEDHYKEGGIGEMIASSFVNDSIDVYSLAVNKIPRSGSTEALLAYEQISADSIVKKVNEILKK